MSTTMSSLSFALRAILLSLHIYGTFTDANAVFPHRHARPHAGLVRFPRRQLDLLNLPEPTTPAPTDATSDADDGVQTTYSLFTPSRGAIPTPITQQFQSETSYAPQITLCSMVLISARQLSANAMHSIPAANASAPLPPPPSYTAPTSTPVPFTPGSGSRIPLYSNSTAPYANTTTPSIPRVTEGCSTTYSPTLTPICRTTIPGPATAYTVTKCDQDLTFSSEYGYQLSLPPGISDPATVVPQSVLPDVQTVTTYYLAPWTALTDPGAVPETVTRKICSPTVSTPTYTLPPGATASLPSPVTLQTCVEEHEAWQTVLVSTVSTTTSHVDISTTVNGPGKLMVETFEAEVTERVTTFSLSSRLVVEVEGMGVSTVMRALRRGASMNEAAATSLAAPGGVALAQKEQVRVTNTITKTVVPVPAPTGTGGVLNGSGEAAAQMENAAQSDSTSTTTATTTAVKGTRTITLTTSRTTTVTGVPGASLA